MKNKRTHYLGKLSQNEIGQEVCVMGWIKKIRDLGELIFIDLRDITGVSQIVINKDSSIFEEVKTLKIESVIAIIGIVNTRQDINENIQTGAIEIIASNLEIINQAAPTPIQIVDDIEASEETRLTYRYLDLRRNEIQEKIKTRYQITKSIRNFLDEKNFIDIETPILTKATPEGARDYLVPSRVNKGEFYALPQSPQIYKNLLMISGFERYYQIVKCFRDEDLRADRQPEFTQIDLEMSFMSQDEIMDLSEEMIKKVFLDIKGLKFNEKFEKMTYQDAMDNYGCDKPDLRFDLKLNDVTSIFSNSEFSVFKNASYVKCLNVLDSANNYSRKDIDKLEELVKKHHGKGLAWLKFIDGKYNGPIIKFLSEDELLELSKKINITENSLVLFVADEYNVVSSSLSALRIHLAKQLNLFSDEIFKFVWIIDWPMFEYVEDENRLYAMHHPFTYPKDGVFNLDNPIKT